MQMSQQDEKLRDVVCKVAVQGEWETGSDGLVLLERESEKIKWVKLADLPSDELREAVAEILTEEGGAHFLVLDEDTQKRHVHIWKITRKEAASSVGPSNGQ
jgi:hypothetical protein